MATDGTMADYCDILRSRSASDTLTVEVLRFDNQEYLEGQLNGRALETSFSFASELQNDVDTTTTGSYDEFVTVQDDSGAIQVISPDHLGRSRRLELGGRRRCHRRRHSGRRQR